MRAETMAIHAGYEAPDPTTNAVAVPIIQTVAYGFESADHAAALFDLEAEGFRYTRISNPTTSVLEKRLTALERGVGALAVASGQAALHYAIVNLLSPQTNIVSVPQLYGTTHTLFTHLLPTLGVEARFAASDRPADVAELIDDNTRLVFAETVGNPAGNVCDLAGLASVAHRRGVPLVVDNTVATPILCRPIEHGADVVVHSLTKFLAGHGTTLGGAIIDSGNFPWRNYPEKYPMFCRPDSSYHGLVFVDRFGNRAFIERARSFYQRITGAVLAPLSAWLILQGIETVALRVDRHVSNGAAVAAHLRGHPKVDFVRYAGFSDSEYHPLVRTYLGGRACSLLTFGVRGGYEGGKKFYDRLKLVKRVVNLGDAKSLACHPASTTHRQMPPDAQLKAGITPATIRMSVGIEHFVDIIDDLDQALEAL